MDRNYTVRPGDSLYAIAQKFDTTIEDLKKINRLSSSLLTVGQVLKIRAIAESGTSIPKHTVQAGESLYVIAKKYGLSVSELKQLNRLASSNLRIGQELVVSVQSATLSESKQP
ncbi:MAG: LysM peptidoglycan-binding domain-containing protein, partial [Bacteroidia bacterium]|nr:LysM peptidoglycan-binding domain-containing protein [Bacteroidia bacterium]